MNGGDDRPAQLAQRVQHPVRTPDAGAAAPLSSWPFAGTGRRRRERPARRPVGIATGRRAGPRWCRGVSTNAAASSVVIALSACGRLSGDDRHSSGPRGIDRRGPVGCGTPAGVPIPHSLHACFVTVAHSVILSPVSPDPHHALAAVLWPWSRPIRAAGRTRFHSVDASARFRRRARPGTWRPASRHGSRRRRTCSAPSAALRRLSVLARAHHVEHSRVSGPSGRPTGWYCGFGCGCRPRCPGGVQRRGPDAHGCVAHRLSLLFQRAVTGALRPHAYGARSGLMLATAS